MPLLEPNIYALWVGKQSAKGTPNTAPGKRLVMVGGNLGAARDDGSENYSDLTKYGSQTDWINSLSGAGEPALQGTPTELAYLYWLMHGAETVSAVTGPPTASRHRFTPTSTMGHYFTAFLRVGATSIRRQQFNDCIITRIAIEASTANKPLRVTPRILSLDPAAIYSADPAAAMPTERPFLHTDLSVNAGATSDGSLVLDGVTYRGVTQWSLVVDDAWEPNYGDDSRPYDFHQGTPTVTVGATLLLDSIALARFNALYYGTTTPTAGTKPLRTVPALGSFKPTLRQRDSVGAFNGLQFVGDVPGVKWTLPDAPAPNPDGGQTEIALAGSMRPIAGQQPYTIDVEAATAVAAFTT